MAHKQVATLPPAVVGLPEVIRLLRELDALDDYLHQAALRKTPVHQVKLPAASPLLTELTKANGLALTKREDYDWLHDSLELIKSKAPQLHIAFSTEPSAEALHKIVTWLRQNIHQTVLVHVGLEPNLAAGCLLRTANHQFDLSLREHFAQSRPLLIKALQAVEQAGKTGAPS